MKKILITGAGGYLGSRLSKYFAEKGFGVIALCHSDINHYNSWKILMDDIIVGDIRDERVVNDISKKNIDIVIHLISLDHFKSENEPNIVSNINVMPTWILLDSLTKIGLEKFIYFSTIHIYGNLPNKIINEDHKPNPLNTYGLTHLLSENICNYYNSKTTTDCINLRLSNSYGSPVFKTNNAWWLVINELCKSAFENKQIKLKSNGTPQRDFIHVSDVARAVNIIVNNNIKVEENVYQISSGKTLTILEIAHKVKSIYNKRYNNNIDIVLPDNSVSECPHILQKDEKHLISNDKITEIGFYPKIDLEIGIEEVFSYLEQHG